MLSSYKCLHRWVMQFAYISDDKQTAHPHCDKTIFSPEKIIFHYVRLISPLSVATFPLVQRSTPVNRTRIEFPIIDSAECTIKPSTLNAIRHPHKQGVVEGVRKNASDALLGGHDQRQPLFVLSNSRMACKGEFHPSCRTAPATISSSGMVY